MPVRIALMFLMRAPAAWAQDASLSATTPNIATAAAANQQGLLEYCAAQGHVPAQAAQTQAGVIATFPPPTDPAMVADAYRKGQNGIVSAMQIEKPLTEAAGEEELSLADLCGQLAAAADQAAAQLP